MPNDFPTPTSRLRETVPSVPAPRRVLRGRALSVKHGYEDPEEDVGASTREPIGSITVENLYVHVCS